MTERWSVFLIALAVVACGCGGPRSGVMAASGVSTNTASNPVSAPPPVPTPTAPAERVLVVSGPLVVENQIDVDAQREGVVATIMIEAGRRVHQGDLLAQLDDRQVSADLDAARARTRSTEADMHNWESEAKVLDVDLQRAQKMFDAALITREQYDHARYKAESDHWDVERVKEMLANARAVERSLGLELEKTRIRAPFDGIVARRYVRAGQKVGLGDRLFWVTAESPLRVRFTLPEIFLGQIRKGQQFQLSSPDVEAAPRNTRVIEVSPVVDPASGTIEVLCELVGPSGALRPGMTVNVRVPGAR
jgi:RND family efflux transporter MFP subunit